MSDSTKTMTINLPVHLTPDEYRLIGVRAADVGALLRDLEADKKSAVKEFASKIETAKLEQTRLESTLRSGTESRPVTCRVVPNVAHGCYDIVHPETGAVVRTEPMDTSEKQLSLDDVAPKAKGDGKGYEPKVGSDILDDLVDHHEAAGGLTRPCEECSMVVRGANKHDTRCSRYTGENATSGQASDDAAPDSDPAPDYSEAAAIATEQLDAAAPKRTRKAKAASATTAPADGEVES